MHSVPCELTYEKYFRRYILNQSKFQTLPFDWCGGQQIKNRFIFEELGSYLKMTEITKNQACLTYSTFPDTELN